MTHYERILIWGLLAMLVTYCVNDFWTTGQIIDNIDELIGLVGGAQERENALYDALLGKR